ncbi:MAG: Lsr2 family DNA-binding protein, partial [Rhodococcus sp. (in: high G+C Gram-positive bacteria)]
TSSMPPKSIQVCANPPPRRGEPDAAAISTPSRTIRQWALAEGHRIRVRGRISYAVIAAYNATH